MTTAVYLRVSTSKQDTSRQEKDLKKHLGENEDYRIYRDVLSGTRTDREGILNLIEDIKKGEIDKVLAWEFTRISRNMSFGSDFIELCTEHDVELETTNDMFPGVKPGNDVFETMINKFAAWMAEFQRQMIRERVQSGVDKAIEEGKWVGNTPYGFETNDEGFLQIQPEDYLAMQQAIERAMNKPEESVNSIAKAFGVPQSTLNRTLKDEDKKQLYLYGETEDQRKKSAIEQADIKPEAEVSKLQERIQELEKKVDD